MSCCESFTALWTCIYCVLAFYIGTSLENGVCSPPGIRRSYPPSCERYQECIKGNWRTFDCPTSHYFLDSSRNCISGAQYEKILAQNSRGTDTNEGQITSTIMFADPNTPPASKAYYNWIPNSSQSRSIRSRSTNCHRKKRRYNQSVKKHSFTSQSFDGSQTTAQPKNLVPLPKATKINTKKLNSLTRPDVADKYLSKNCGQSFDEEKIMGGAEAPITKAPWMVAVMKKIDKTNPCGGSIITKYHVITAASCFRDKENMSDTFRNVNDYEVWAGTNDKRVEVFTFEIAEIYKHSGYSFKHPQNNIALIKVNGSFPFGASVQPICLPDIVEGNLRGTFCVIGGWEEHSPRLTLTARKIMNNSDCMFWNNSIEKSIERKICAGSYQQKGSGACLGSSGGPLACFINGAYTLYGVTTVGRGCVTEIKPGVTTRVASYLTWIKIRIVASMEGIDISRIPIAYDYDDESIHSKSLTTLN